jgi:hypothetical protein
LRRFEGPDRVVGSLGSRSPGKKGGTTPNWRSTLGTIAGGLAIGLLALAPQANAREAAKFKVLSVSGSETTVRDAAYDPSIYGSCAFSTTERIRFHSTKRATAYAFTSKAHGRARVAWSEEPDYTSNFTQVEVPAEVTISRSATYNQTNYVDPDTGETVPGCWDEFSPVNCSIERTLPATLNLGGTSGTDKSTYVELVVQPGALNELDDACVVASGSFSGLAPGLFARADLFKRKPKRLSDSDRVEGTFDDPPDYGTGTRTNVQELTAELKRRKPQREKKSGMLGSATGESAVQPIIASSVTQ